MPVMRTGGVDPMMITGGLIALFVLLLVALPTIFKSFGVNQEYERAVLFRLGRLGEPKGPGWYWLIPWIDRVAIGIVRPKRVRADQFGQIVGLVRGRPLDAAHFGQAYLEAGLGKLPRRFRSGETAADNVNLVRHGAGE